MRKIIIEKEYAVMPPNKIKIIFKLIDTKIIQFFELGKPIIMKKEIVLNGVFTGYRGFIIKKYEKNFSITLTNIDGSLTNITSVTYSALKHSIKITEKDNYFSMIVEEKLI